MSEEQQNRAEQGEVFNAVTKHAVKKRLLFPSSNTCHLLDSSHLYRVDSTADTWHLVDLIVKNTKMALFWSEVDPVASSKSHITSKIVLLLQAFHVWLKF